MKNRSKLMIVAAVAASCVLLAGCGSSASSTASSAASSESAPGSVVLSQVESALPDDGTNSPDELADEVNTLLEANPIANQFEIAAMNIEYDFGLKAEDVAGYKGVKSNDNGDAGLVLVIEPAEGKADDIVDRIAPGLTLAALSEDGIVEAIEKPDAKFCLGVQWHPEWLSAADPAMQGLFDAFVAACRH